MLGTEQHPKRTIVLILAAIIVIASWKTTPWSGISIFSHLRLFKRSVVLTHRRPIAWIGRITYRALHLTKHPACFLTDDLTNPVFINTHRCTSRCYFHDETR